MNECLYMYKATVAEVYDGDTVTVLLSLGFDLEQRMKIRLYGINTPEMRGSTKERATVARDVLRNLVLDKEVIVKTRKDRKEKYGRYLAEIFLTLGSETINVNEFMVEGGYASRFMEDN